MLAKTLTFRDESNSVANYEEFFYNDNIMEVFLRFLFPSTVYDLQQFVYCFTSLLHEFCKNEIKL